MSVVAQPIQRCQCAACAIAAAPHASWCAVHNAPALPIGDCNCGMQRLKEMIFATEIIKHGVN